MVLNNFFEISIISITRLSTDTDGDVYTLPVFKNFVRKSIKQEYVDDFSAHLKLTKFDSKVQNLLNRARILRNGSIAHIKKEAMEDSAGLNLNELESLRDALNTLLDSLSFDVVHMMLPIDYDDQVQHPVGTDSRSDIEKILDQVASNSRKLNFPEKKPIIWERIKQKMNPDELQIINEYRKKLGLPEA